MLLCYLQNLSVFINKFFYYKTNELLLINKDKGAVVRNIFKGG